MGRCNHWTQIEHAETFDQLLQGIDHLPVESRLLPRQHIDVGMFEVAQKLALEAAFPARQESLRDIEVIVGKLLPAAGFGQRFLHLLEPRCATAAGRERVWAIHPSGGQND